MRTSDFDYELPLRYIAQTPIEPRDRSRLMVLNRQSGEINHAVFKDIGEYLHPGDILVLNETRVIPARLYAHKLPSRGKVEILLLRQRDNLTWEALVGGKGLTVGKKLQVEAIREGDRAPLAQIEAVLHGAERLVRFSEPLELFFPKVGHTPLPPYIHTPINDPERYQTVYARTSGSAAAPTAGLHFTPWLMDELKSRGIKFAKVTLHVGLDTFAPVTEGDPTKHKIHSEWCQLTEQNAMAINAVKAAGGRVVAVGTTSVRTLESAAADGMLRPYEGATGLYILPGYHFNAVDAIVTNFHLPRSTLIMLVSAFATRELVSKAYEIAKNENYRFYSFGDAMLIV
ncbi:MAG: tRNA preQ1(34) S-adenosylmethionine ribosyltransferase-isomerase QueA [Anaerolineales bacterium]|nr:tRNA preQ1(34) S-adenosylmethionine ribosyltransferase-isomerase QueA [Anaerolineae bacterium]PWB55382.1 MAG: tRNA preQ1(34) S-adenosylmethionine ribosyltransferase-isomerase QueA [Anaerolineales bacterium]